MSSSSGSRSTLQPLFEVPNKYQVKVKVKVNFMFKITQFRKKGKVTDKLKVMQFMIKVTFIVCVF